MMSESPDEQLSRLKQMCEPGQQTWDLSPKDVAAIEMAVRVVESQADSPFREPFTNPASGMGIPKP
jgi:hypothetical protein